MEETAAVVLNDHAVPISSILPAHENGHLFVVYSKAPCQCKYYMIVLLVAPRKTGQSESGGQSDARRPVSTSSIPKSLYMFHGSLHPDVRERAEKKHHPAERDEDPPDKKDDPGLEELDEGYPGDEEGQGGADVGEERPGVGHDGAIDGQDVPEDEAVPAESCVGVFFIFHGSIFPGMYWRASYRVRAVASRNRLFASGSTRQKRHPEAVGDHEPGVAAGREDMPFQGKALRRCMHVHRFLSYSGAKAHAP